MVLDHSSISPSPQMPLVRSLPLLIPKGYNSLHSPLATICDRTNHSKSAPPYPKTPDYGAVQSDAPTREPPHTHHRSRQHRHTERENINLPCVRRKPSASLTSVPEPTEEKLQHDCQKQQSAYLKSDEGDRAFGKIWVPAISGCDRH
ncbi:hypothetical protein NDI49_05405 [Trichocoleus sp. ST-U3]